MLPLSSSAPSELTGGYVDLDGADPDAGRLHFVRAGQRP